MSAHVLLILLILLLKFGKRDKMLGLPSILSLFRNEFNKFNNTNTFFLSYDKSHFWHEKVDISPSFTQLYNGRHNVSQKSIKLVILNVIFIQYSWMTSLRPEIS